MNRIVGVMLGGVLGVGATVSGLFNTRLAVAGVLVGIGMHVVASLVARATSQR